MKNGWEVNSVYMSEVSNDLSRCSDDLSNVSDDLAGVSDDCASPIGDRAGVPVEPARMKLYRAGV